MQENPGKYSVFYYHGRPGNSCLVRSEFIQSMSVTEYDGVETPVFDKKKHVLLQIEGHFARETKLAKEVCDDWQAKASASDIFYIIEWRWDSHSFSRYCNAASSTIKLI